MKKAVRIGLTLALLFIMGIGAYRQDAAEKRQAGEGTIANGERDAIEERESEKVGAREKALTIWAWDDTFNVKAAKMAAEEIKKTHSEIRVKVESMDQNVILEKLQNSLATDTYEELPDIVLIEDYKIQKLLSKYEGQFLDLTDLFDFDYFMEYKTNVSCKDGRHYGIPFDSGTAVMFYRKDLIEQAGYCEEDMRDLTWKKYIEIGKKVKEKTGVSMLTIEPADLGLLRIMQQSAGYWYVESDGLNVNFTENCGLRDAVDVYKKLVKTGIAESVSGWNDFVDAFQEGRVATVVTGCWAMSSVKENGDQAGKWRVASIPRMERNENSINASNIGGSGWYILKNRPYTEEAVTFMQETFAYNEGFMNRLIREIGVVTAYKDSQRMEAYQDEDAFFGNQRVNLFLAETAQRIPKVNYGFRTYELEQILEEALQEIINGKDEDLILEQAEIKARAVVDE